MRSVWIGVAGCFGAISRYQVEGFIARRTTGAFPWGTLAVNMSGCFLLGFLATLFTERLMPHPTVRAALTIGFIGAYTTFSTFAFETLRLEQDHAAGLATLNVVVSVAVGVVAVWIGTVVGRAA